jgi:hypothetical protein
VTFPEIKIWRRYMMKIGLIALLTVCLMATVSASNGNVVVYDEIPIKYPWSEAMGEFSGESLKVDAFSQETPQNGLFCTKISYDGQKENWASTFLQATGDSRSGEGIGLDLSGAKVLTFYARGSSGNELVRFGYGYDTPSSSGSTDSSYHNQVERLTREWKKFEIPLQGKDLSHINGLFNVKLEKKDNPENTVIYLDNIAYMQ